MKSFLLLLFTLPVGAQISGPQLGLVTHGGAMRRIEGLSGSSRLSDPLKGLPACTRIEAAPGGRWALCGTVEAMLLIDLRDLSSRAIPAFERVVWSPSGTAMAVDADVYILPERTRFENGTVVAVSDSGSTAVRDIGGGLQLRGEAVATGAQPQAAVAFDGEALLAGMQDSIVRIEPGRSSQRFHLGFEAALLGADGNAMYAASGRALARIDRATGSVAIFELPVPDATITRLERLSDGSLLLVKPDFGEPGWLFQGRSGKFSFIPGIPVETERAQ